MQDLSESHDGKVRYSSSVTTVTTLNTHLDFVVQGITPVSEDDRLMVWNTSGLGMNRTTTCLFRLSRFRYLIDVPKATTYEIIYSY